MLAVEIAAGILLAIAVPIVALSLFGAFSAVLEGLSQVLEGISHLLSQRFFWYYAFGVSLAVMAICALLISLGSASRMTWDILESDAAITAFVGWMWAFFRYRWVRWIGGSVLGGLIALSVSIAVAASLGFVR